MKLLNLTTGLDSKELETAVGHHVRPAALTLHVNSPAAGVWLPQLRQCNVRVHTNDQMAHLSSRLEGALLTQLSSLVLHDERPLAAREASLPALPTLPLLPALRKLVRGSEGKWLGA